MAQRTIVMYKYVFVGEEKNEVLARKEKKMKRKKPTKKKKLKQNKLNEHYLIG